MGLIPALVADALAIVVFAAIGRRSHDEAEEITALLGTAAPFLVALAVGWTLVVALDRAGVGRVEPRHVGGGVIIWSVTVAVGLVLRRTLWDRGTAFAFVVVATLFLGVVLIGWRIGYHQLRGGRARG